MKNLLAFCITLICFWTVVASDIIPDVIPINGVLHQDTSTHSFRLMTAPIKLNEVEITLCTRNLEPTLNNLSEVYSFRFYHINQEEIVMKISFCSINEVGKEVWSIPTEVHVSATKGTYQENSLENLSANLDLNLLKISKLKIIVNKAAFLDEFEFYYFQKDKNELKPNMRDLRKKLKAEKQKQKDKNSKEYNTIREAEYKDHF